MAFILGIIIGISALLFSMYFKIDFLITLIIFEIVSLVNMHGGICIKSKHK